MHPVTNPRQMGYGVTPFTSRSDHQPQQAESPISNGSFLASVDPQSAVHWCYTPAVTRCPCQVSEPQCFWVWAGHGFDEFGLPRDQFNEFAIR